MTVTACGRGAQGEPVPPHSLTQWEGAERRTWIESMTGEVWSRLTAVPPLTPLGMSHGWGPHGVAAAYRRCFGRPPQTDRRRRYVYSEAELMAVAALLEQEATASWRTGR